jgi:hypothetical protein
MPINERAALSPDALLFEIAALCSRHGIAVSSANHGAARHYAERLMHALGLIDESPAAAIAPPAPSAADTAHLPIVRDGAFVGDETAWRDRVRRGAHRVSRPLSAVPPLNGGA